MTASGSRGPGCPFGSHRAGGALPQSALCVDADPQIRDDELRIEVERLNLDSSSMRQIAEACGGDLDRIRARIAEIVATRGKMHNPVTGSGGVLIGRIDAIGPAYPDRGITRGDAVCTLISLSLTPLKLRRIGEIDLRTGQVEAEGTAILFESGLFTKLPGDMPSAMAMALCDVAGAPATVLRVARPGDRIAVLGAGGKAGLLSLYAARERLGRTGQLIALDLGREACARIDRQAIADRVLDIDLRDPIATHRAMMEATGGALADLTLNMTNAAGTEGAAILSTRQRGRIVFFSMATSFQAAALGAEGLGRDVEMWIGNGYLEGWVEQAFSLARAHPKLWDEFRRL
jgi:L-erythro-3,5-diaminohexanoate dehydrogenase